jgi:hypothetical protein
MFLCWQVDWLLKHFLTELSDKPDKTVHYCFSVNISLDASTRMDFIYSFIEESYLKVRFFWDVTSYLLTYYLLHGGESFLRS